MELAVAFQNALYILEETRVRPTLSCPTQPGNCCAKVGREEHMLRPVEPETEPKTHSGVFVEDGSELWEHGSVVATEDDLSTS